MSSASKMLNSTYNDGDYSLFLAHNHYKMNRISRSGRSTKHCNDIAYKRNFHSTEYRTKERKRFWAYKL